MTGATVEFPCCGFVRTVTHDDIVDGTWMMPCPNCTPPDDDASADDESGVPA